METSNIPTLEERFIPGFCGRISCPPCLENGVESKKHPNVGSVQFVRDAERGYNQKVQYLLRERDLNDFGLIPVFLDWS